MGKRRSSGISRSEQWPALVLAAALTVLVSASVAFAAEEKPAGEKAAGEQQQSPSASVVRDDPSFHYESAGRRDPFKSLLELGPRPGPPPEDLPPIQRIDLKAVKINGVILDDASGNQAMIKAGGQSFVVRTGMIIGKNEGEIIEVTLDGIRVVEKFVDFMGRETLKEIFIKSRPTEENK